MPSPNANAAPQLPPLPEGPALDRVRGPIEIPAYETWQLVLAIAFASLAIGGILWLIWSRRHRATPTVPPYEAALRELDAAAELTTGDDERFATLTSLALRRYLEQALGLRFSARTSEEFLRSLKGDTRFGEPFHQQLGETLAAFDRVKFAEGKFETQTRIRLTDTVRGLIEEVHSKETQKGGDS